MMRRPVNRDDFYNEYHGHKVADLRKALRLLRRSDTKKPRPAVWLVGDSSLDNKYWLPRSMQPAINGFEAVLSPPKMIPDVAYWVNRALVNNHSLKNAFCLNCAVEESTVRDRKDSLLPQDAFVRDNLMEQDIVIVSVGGNDIALRPTVATVASMASLILQPVSWISSGRAVGMEYMISLMKDSVQDYLEKVCMKCKPKTVLVCMIYYLDEDPNSESWANTTLRCLGYNSNPTKVQLLIRKCFELATTQIRLEGVDVIPFPLFEVLDGKNSADYVARVEPSVKGGEKMGRAFVKVL